MSTFQAQYGGTCDSCEERIKPGDRVRYVGDGVLIHAACADPDLRVRRRAVKEVVCTTCFLVRPCGCDDDSAISRQGEPDTLFRSQDGGQVG